MKWFNPTPKTCEELKKMYHKLVMQYHPDRKGGSNEAMVEINNEYDNLFARLKDVHQTATGETYTKETSETPEQFKDIINKLIHFEGIAIEICGSWIWITGNTYTYREQLKEMKIKFSRNKTAWYFHTEKYRKRGKSSLSMDDIREMFGSEAIETKQMKITA